MKRCTKCGIEKPITEFYKRLDGSSYYCKPCTKIQVSNNYQNNKGRYKQYNKNYSLLNKENIKEYKKRYNTEHKLDKKEYNRNYYLKNKESIKKHSKEYRKNNSIVVRKKDSIRKKISKSKPCSSVVLFSRIPITDKAKIINDTITVVCKNCTNRFIPTSAQVQSRVLAYEGKALGEANLYCSEECKLLCPIYGFHPHSQIDKRSIVSKATNSRNCQTYHLKSAQCDKHGHNYCEKCGDIIDVELHHTLTVAKFGDDSINPAGHILLCFNCHMEIHRECA